MVIVRTHRHKNVFMAQRETKGGVVDRAQYGLYIRHGSSNSGVF
jgi:hypothetical protein